MDRILTPKQMSDAEAASVQLGVSLWHLMNNAGIKLADIIKDRAEKLEAKSILFLCGSGNNGGDGFVAATLLHQLGFEVHIALMCGEPKTELAKKALSLPGGTDIICSADALPDTDILADCIFGTGFHGEFRNGLGEKLAALANTKSFKIACDMPSGVDALTGSAAKGTLPCDETVTFHRCKLGMTLSPAKALCGRMTVADIGIPSDWKKLLSDKTYIFAPSAEKLHKLLPHRPQHSHKGTFGRLLLVCGSEGYIGAGAVASRAALRTGCGITQLAAPRFVVQTIAGGAPECVYTPLPADEDGCISASALPQILSLAENADAVVAGCGMGQGGGTAGIIEALVKNVKVPLVIDADGINLLSANIDILRDKHCEIILTPHMGELARLGNVSLPEALRDRYELCRRLSEKYGVVIHSKDTSSITFFGEKAAVTSFGCSALAKGGSGDMLAGVIGSLLAQGLGAAEACAAADYIVGSSAQMLCENRAEAAVTATDIISYFRKSLKLL